MLSPPRANKCLLGRARTSITLDGLAATSKRMAGVQCDSITLTATAKTRALARGLWPLCDPDVPDKTLLFSFTQPYPLFSIESVSAAGSIASIQVEQTVLGYNSGVESVSADADLITIQLEQTEIPPIEYSADTEGVGAGANITMIQLEETVVPFTGDTEAVGAGATITEVTLI